MIDMSSLYIHSNYSTVLNSFNVQKASTDCDCLDWILFNELHLEVSKGKCPICEYTFSENFTRPSNNGTTTIKPTIDHYRPINLYPLLKCDDKNYLLMCSECNTSYKDNLFPLHASTPDRDTISMSISNSIIEKPLIVNPIFDNLSDLFTLIFVTNQNGKKILALKPKNNEGYLYEKAKKTIEIFGLGNCSTSIHPNQNIHNCRITVLEYNYEKFFDFAKAAKELFSDKYNRDKKLKLASILKMNPTLKDFGFYTFIVHNNFKILV